MAQLDARLSQADREAVNQAVQHAELLTCAEFIPVIAASSGRYDRSEDVVGLWAGIAVLVAIWLAFPIDPAPAAWGPFSSSLWHLVACVAGLIGGFLGGTILASRVNGLRRLFTPKRQLRDEVQMRARAVFFDQRVHHTAGAAGLLFYVSLFERVATVLADQSVLEKLGQSQIDAICADLTGRLQTISPTAALAETISEAGQRLSQAMPRTEVDENEHSDALVLLD